MDIIVGDISDVDYGLIIHVCNNKNAMGAGVAKALYTKWPWVKSEYHEYFDEGRRKDLGNVQFVTISPNLFVANMIAQDGYGRDGKCYLDYTALKDALSMVDFEITRANEAAGYLPGSFPIFLPWGMGAGLAGGDWWTVFDMVEETLDKHHVIGVMYGDGLDELWG